VDASLIEDRSQATVGGKPGAGRSGNGAATADGGGSLNMAQLLSNAMNNRRAGVESSDEEDDDDGGDDWD